MSRRDHSTASREGRSSTKSRKPLIAHVVHSFDIGGMENGVVNLLNGLPPGLADHCVISLTRVNPAFAARVTLPGVRYLEMHKPPGQTARILPQVWRALRGLRPTVLHTRNVATLEVQIAGWAAGVPVRIHGEHGWDVSDLDGSNRRMLWLRRAMRRFVHHQIALSVATERYLVERVGVPRGKVTNICNGVDTDRFRPADDRRHARAAVLPADWPADAFVVGAIGRIAAVKNLPMLVDAFAALRKRNAAFASRARLAIVGAGPEMERVRAHIARHSLDAVTWLPGSRDDVPACLKCLDLLCLPSLAEGISNTVLEAMASGVAIVATDVGGNRDLIVPSQTGELVGSGRTDDLARHVERYFNEPERLETHGRNARLRAVTEFSLEGMIAQYHRVYAEQLRRIGLAADTTVQGSSPLHGT